jgi:hypothetical protein
VRIGDNSQTQHQFIRETKKLLEETAQLKGQNVKECFILMQQINGELRYWGNSDVSEEELVDVCTVGIDSPV